MTDNNHPITPPPELFAEWIANSMKTVGRTIPENDRGATGLIAGEVVIQAARWGADQQLKLDAEQVNQAWQRGADHELEACCEWLIAHYWKAASEQLRAARRPKPLSLKELNLKHLEVMERDGHYLPEIIADLRRAIESLPS